MWRWIIRVHHRRFEGDVAGKTLYELPLEHINWWNYAEFDCDLAFFTNSDVGFLVLFLIFIQQTLVFFHARFWCFLYPFLPFALCLPNIPFSPLARSPAFPSLSSLFRRLHPDYVINSARKRNPRPTHTIYVNVSLGAITTNTIPRFAFPCPPPRPTPPAARTISP